MRAASPARGGARPPVLRVTLGKATVELGRLTPVGQGGEAEVFDLGDGRALKIFKPPTHADYAGDPAQAEAARLRLREHQVKLARFPAGLPAHVVAPAALARDGGGEIVGYAMPLVRDAEVLLRYARREFRHAGGITGQDVAGIFLDLHATVAGVHAAQAVIGDFNDLNVLVKGRTPWLIDADSYQFGPFMATTFTERFVDPLLCDPAATRPVLHRPYTADADWYAFAVLLFQSLLYVDPYGGTYAPADASLRIPHAMRPLRRITVFDPAVRVPKVAERWDVLPDDLLHRFDQTFARDLRGAFPRPLLEGFRWTRCGACGTGHARATCPRCARVHPARVREATRVRGTVTATRVFHEGTILHAALQDGALRWVWHDGTRFRRENGEVVLTGGLERNTRWRVQGDTTVLARGHDACALAPGRAPQRFEVGTFGQTPVFDTLAARRFHLRMDGRIEASGGLGPSVVTSAIPGATLFWAGTHFAFGFWRAGEMTSGFVFDTVTGAAISDRVDVGRIRGQIVDGACHFSPERCWFFLRTREEGRTRVRLQVVLKSGTVEASLEGTPADTPWLAGFGGAAAAGASLLVPTDAGIVRLACENGAVEVRSSFPDTEPFVSAGHGLFAAPDRLYCVGPASVTTLAIRS